MGFTQFSWYIISVWKCMCLSSFMHIEVWVGGEVCRNSTPSPPKQNLRHFPATSWPPFLHARSSVMGLGHHITPTKPQTSQLSSPFVSSLNPRVVLRLKEQHRLSYALKVVKSISSNWLQSRLLFKIHHHLSINSMKLGCNFLPLLVFVLIAILYALLVATELFTLQGQFCDLYWWRLGFSMIIVCFICGHISWKYWKSNSIRSSCFLRCFDLGVLWWHHDYKVVDFIGTISFSFSLHPNLKQELGRPPLVFFIDGVGHWI